MLSVCTSKIDRISSDLQWGNKTQSILVESSAYIKVLVSSEKCSRTLINYN